MPQETGGRHQHLARVLLLVLSLAASALPPGAQASLALEHRTRVITTYSERPDGTIVENRGSAVLVGQHLLTVLHNLQPPAAQGALKVSSYVDGHQVTPIYTDAAMDVAVMPIPDALCPQWCTQDVDLPAKDPSLNDSIRWYRNPATGTADPPGWHAATVMGRTWSQPDEGSGSTPEGCSAGLVLEVNRPFRPGISGAGIWDAQDRLVGIAQGSFRTRDGRETGYFKPLRCIRALNGRRRRP